MSTCIIELDSPSFDCLSDNKRLTGRVLLPLLCVWGIPSATAMRVTYRKNKVLIGSDWHFEIGCPHWPEKDFLESSFLNPEKGDRLCPYCTRLNSQCVHPKHPETVSKAAALEIQELHAVSKIILC